MLTRIQFPSTLYSNYQTKKNIFAIIKTIKIIYLDFNVYYSELHIQSIKIAHFSSTIVSVSGPLSFIY